MLEEQSASRYFLGDINAHFPSKAFEMCCCETNKQNMDIDISYYLKILIDSAFKLINKVGHTRAHTHLLL